MSATPGTIDHAFSPDDDVYVIFSKTGCDPAVFSGVVIQVRANVLTGLGSPPVSTTVKYDIRLTDEAGTRELLEADVFGTLNEAITEYEARLTP